MPPPTISYGATGTQGASLLPDVILSGKADTDGLLPPRTRWWDEDDVASLFPDAATRAPIEREQPRLHLSYFEASLTASPGWDNRPMAYLAFGDIYAAERADADHRGWPTTTLAGCATCTCFTTPARSRSS